MRRLRHPDPRPVHPAGSAGPGVARGLPQVPGVPPVPGRELYLLREGRQNVL